MWSLLADPVPRITPGTYSPVTWRISHRRALEAVIDVEMDSLSAVLESRHTERSFAPVPSSLLSKLLWHSARAKATAISPLGLPIEHRPLPSAGALHPIHLIVQLPEEAAWACYNPYHHSLDIIQDAALHLTELANHSERIIPHGKGTLIVFAAEAGKVAAKYENPESLIWRDAGVLQGGITLVATALGLNYCPLGITGNPWVSALADEGKLIGVGMAILGARP